MNFNLHTSTFFAVAAFAAIPAFGQRTAEQTPNSNPTTRRFGSDATESVTKIEARRASMVHGHDSASPAPFGRRTLAEPNPEVFTGLTDEELASSTRRNASFAPDRSRVYYNQSADGTWIRGRNYKAHAAADGFTFIPFLGSKAERNWPVTFRLDSAVLEGRALDLDADAVVSRNGDRVVLDRGPVDVVYDISHESVEQSFIVDAAGAEGDLVLELDVHSDLQRYADGKGFQFAGDRGGMTYSAAIVLDSTGRTAEVPARLRGDKLSLTVSSEFLRAAEGLVVVDPILSTYTVDAVSGNQNGIEVAYDRSTDAYTYVYEDEFSGTDLDVYSTTIDAGGNVVSSRYIDSSSEDWRRPSIANLNNSDKHLFVAERVNAATGYSEIVGRILDIPTDALGPEIVIGAGNASWDNHRPDVGGNSKGGPGAVFAVVWERQFSTSTQPRLRTVASDGTMGPVSFFDAGAAERTGVVISQSTGDPTSVNVWNVAYRSVDNATGQESVRGAQFNEMGGVIEPPADLWTAPLGDSVSEIDVSDALDLDGLDPTYIVTFERTPSPEEDTLVLFCRNNRGIGSPRQLQESEHADLALTQGLARVSTTDEDFVVTYTESDGWVDPKTVITTFDLTEGAYMAISERRTLVTETGGIFTEAPMASRFSGGLYPSRYVALGWAESNGTDTDVLGGVFFANAPYAQGFQYGYGNPNRTGDRGFLTLYGNRSTVTAKTLTASALPVGSFGIFICGPDFDEVPNPAGSDGVLLVGGSIGRFVGPGQILSADADGSFSLSIDPANLPQSIGFAAASAGQIWQFQAWHRDFGFGGPTSNFTNGVTIQFR